MCRKRCAVDAGVGDAAEEAAAPPPKRVRFAAQSLMRFLVGESPVAPPAPACESAGEVVVALDAGVPRVDAVAVAAAAVADVAVQTKDEDGPALDALLVHELVMCEAHQLEALTAEDVLERAAGSPAVLGAVRARLEGILADLRAKGSATLMPSAFQIFDLFTPFVVLALGVVAEAASLAVSTGHEAVGGGGGGAAAAGGGGGAAAEDGGGNETEDAAPEGEETPARPTTPPTPSCRAQAHSPDTPAFDTAGCC